MIRQHPLAFGVAAGGLVRIALASILFAQAALRRTDTVTCVAFAGGLSALLLLIGSFASDIDWPSSGAGIASLAALAVVIIASQRGRLVGVPAPVEGGP